MKTKPGRDYTVELWRFIFCIAVLGFHFFSKIDVSIMRAGYLGVEFFFLLSGYGVFVWYEKRMMKKEMKDKLTQLGSYIGSRIVKLYPLYMFSLFLMLMLKMFQNKWMIADVFAYLKTEWAELLWLQCGPLGNEVLISALWYVPAMFWGSVILLVLLMFTGRVGGMLLCPVISLLIYSYYFRLIHKIDVIFSYHAVLRGIAGLALGVAIGFWCHTLREKDGEKSRLPERIEARNRIGSLIGYVIANSILLSVFIYMNFGRRSNWDFFVIFLYALSLLILLFIRMPLSESISKRFAFLSGLTYPVYVLQMPVIELLLMLIK